MKTSGAFCRAIRPMNATVNCSPAARGRNTASFGFTVSPPSGAMTTRSAGIRCTSVIQRARLGEITWCVVIDFDAIALLRG